MGKFTPIRRACSLLLGAGLAVIGCGKADGTKPNGPNAPLAKTNSVWEPDPGWASEMSQTLTFDRYQISAPKSLKAVPEATQTVGSLHVFTWRIESGADLPKALLSATIADDKKMVDEARNNMKQTLINFTAGSTRPLNIEVKRESDVETGSLSGIPFSRFKWRGDGQPSRGLSYGGVNGDQAILFVVICFGQDSEATQGLMQAVLATLKKQ
jgi:hypothetical protein